MLKKLCLKNFKCFPDLKVDLANLTLLCGLNGTGKSSLIQSLLLLHQSFLEQRLKLNGDLLTLGNPSDVIAANALDNEMSLYIEFEDSQNFSLSAQYDIQHNRFINEEQKEEPSHLRKKALLSKNSVFYICADRFGPRITHPLSEEGGLVSHLGKHGEFSAHYLNVNGENPLPNERFETLAHSGKSRRLDHQVQAWLREIVPGVRFDISSVEMTDLATMRYAFEGGGDVTPFFRPTNVAFGISYSLPVVLSLLAMPKGGLVILENPEAHLHPQGQTMMGELITRVAAAGTQVIVETHSEHIVRRIQSRVAEEFLTENQALIYFSQYEGGNSSLEKLHMDEYGRIKNWPKDFFGDTLGEIERQTRTIFKRMKEKKKGGNHGG